MPGVITVVGGVWEFMPDGTLPTPYLGVLAAVTGRFVPNVSPATALPVDDGAGVMHLTPVDFTVLSDGQISADGENPGVALTADDESYGLGRPLRWCLVVDPFELNSEVIEPPAVWADAAEAGEAGDEVPLSLWAAEVEVWPIAVARGPRGFRGLTGPGVIPGEGDPEGSVAAPVGTLYSRSDGGIGNAGYLKEVGSGSTGWSALVTASALEAAVVAAVDAALEEAEES